MQKNTVDYFLRLPYTIELIPDQESGWFVQIKELSGCMSQGESPDEAMANIKEAQRLWIEAALENGYPIPEPQIEQDFSGKFVVRLPKSLHRQLVERAEEEGVSLNQLVNVFLAGSISQRKGENSEKPTVGEVILWPGLDPALKKP